ncbi:type III secretion protein [Pseudomonas orientalis]|uniref:type III secretion protein n=1 Tax=Pseudomonas orientalis TaxID=76758 RepID=UPI000F716777|nr:type III secretion protein [Pseudomonas orientalis]AZE87454.1 type III secretion protein HrpD [Pseudomonas orientalis]
MHELHAWVNWWACPWDQSRHQWGAFDLNSAAAKALCRSRHELISLALGITPCLPIQPSPALLKMVLASAEQRDLMLLLIDGIYYPHHGSELSTNNRLWCARLSKAMPPASSNTREDPLHYLHDWVEPSVWQRLRLSFARRRVQVLESTKAPEPRGKLDTVWQAAIWRATSATDEDPQADPPGVLPHDAMPTQD